jgi:hypothetical protein
VDRAQNSLVVCRQLLQKLEDAPGRLGIETGGRLIEEQEELGLSHKLDTDGQALALLDIET